MISLSTIIIISLATLGIHLITREGMIFGFVEDFWKYKRGFADYISKPISECPTCMGSLWGGLGYIVLTDSFSLLNMIITILAVAAMNTIFYRFTE